MTRQGNSLPLHSCSSPHPALCSYNLLAPPISPEPQQCCLQAQFRCHFCPSAFTRSSYPGRGFSGPLPRTGAGQSSALGSMGQGRLNGLKPFPRLSHSGDR